MRTRASGRSPRSRADRSAPPTARISTSAWLNHLQRSVVRFPGGSGVFVSPEGLVLTNHHVALEHADDAVVERRNLVGRRLHWRRTRSDELRAPDLELLVLDRIEDVTGARQRRGQARTERRRGLSRAPRRDRRGRARRRPTRSRPRAKSSPSTRGRSITCIATSATLTSASSSLPNSTSPSSAAIPTTSPSPAIAST